MKKQTPLAVKFALEELSIADLVCLKTDLNLAMKGHCADVANTQGDSETMEGLSKIGAEILEKSEQVEREIKRRYHRIFG